MSKMLLVLVAASQTFYEAKVPTFGCNSSADVAKLQALRTDPAGFKKELIAQVAYGQCIAIDKGVVIDGSIEEAEKAVLRVGRAVDPPGYMAPLDDFTETTKAQTP